MVLEEVALVVFHLTLLRLDCFNVICVIMLISKFKTYTSNEFSCFPS